MQLAGNFLLAVGRSFFERIAQVQQNMRMFVGQKASVPYRARYLSPLVEVGPHIPL